MCDSRSKFDGNRRPDSQTPRNTLNTPRNTRNKSNEDWMSKTAPILQRDPTYLRMEREWNAYVLHYVKN